MDPTPPEPRISKFGVIAQWALTLGVLFVVFGWLLPKFIDYGDVLDSIRSLTGLETLVLLISAALLSLSTSAIYTSVIPGLGFWPGWQTYEASSTLASFAPAGVDLAVRYGMYRSFGVPSDLAGAGFVLSAIFTIGVKFALPVVALIMVLIQGGYENSTLIWLIVSLSIGAMAVSAIALRREAFARWIGRTVQTWYNKLLANRWRLERIDDLDDRLVAYRRTVVETLSKSWKRAGAATAAAQLISFSILVMAIRFVGVGGIDASLEAIFVAYSVGLIASMTPFLPQGLGAVELVYVLVLAGEPGTELADQIMAAAFLHRIFTWFLPILAGVVPLLIWRRRMSRRAGKATATN